MNFLLAVRAHHHGEGVVDHALAEAHAGDGVVFKFANGSPAGGAFVHPVT